MSVMQLGRELGYSWCYETVSINNAKILKLVDDSSDFLGILHNSISASISINLIFKFVTKI